MADVSQRPGKEGDAESAPEGAVDVAVDPTVDVAAAPVEKETEAEATPDVKVEVRPDAEPEAKSDEKTEAEPAVAAGAASDEKAEAEPKPETAEAKPEAEAKADEKPEAKAEEQTDEKAEEKTGVKAEDDRRVEPPDNGTPVRDLTLKLGPDGQVAVVPTPGAESETTSETTSGIEAQSADDDVTAPVSLAAKRRGKPSRWTVLVACLAVLALGLAVSGVLLYLRNQSVADLAASREAAVTAAKQVATDLTSISADNAQQRIDSLSQSSTGDFKSQITTYAAVLQAVLKQSQAGSTGTVSGAAVEKIDDATASVLVAVAATVSNNKLPTAQAVSYRLAVQLKREGDRWLTTDLSFVS